LKARKYFIRARNISLWVVKDLVCVFKMPIGIFSDAAKYPDKPIR
jgi:hypothetical protein